jgi:homocysteine S-methyltransferase
VRAGADVIETNTFGANRVKLGAFGLADACTRSTCRGRRSRGTRRAIRSYVAGAIGPLGIRVEPVGQDRASTRPGGILPRAGAALVEGGVDLFILETFRDVNEIGAAIRAVRSLGDLPIVAQMTTEEDGNSLDGVAPETFVPSSSSSAPTSSGLNCSVGPAPMLETLERMARVTHGSSSGAAQRRQAA